MESTVAALLAPGKSILAADESFVTIEKRFNALNIPSIEEGETLERFHWTCGVLSHENSGKYSVLSTAYRYIISDIALVLVNEELLNT